jgi:hypothetical protein
MQSVVNELSFAQLAETGFRPRLQQAKLGLRQTHVRTDLILTLLINIKPGQGLSVPLRRLSEDLPDESDSLAEDRRLLGISTRIRCAHNGIELRLFAPVVYHSVDLCRHLPADYSAHESHQPLRFPQLSPANGLHHNQEGIVDFVVQILRPQVAAQIESDSARKKLIELLHAIGL